MMPIKLSLFAFLALLINTMGVVDALAKESNKIAPATIKKSAVSKANNNSGKAEIISQGMPRIDVPVTPANSYLQDFGDGLMLRIPKILYPSLDYANLKQPIRANSIGMTFWYPDMTQTQWDPSISTILQKERGTYIPQTDRFKVRILWMWHVPPDSDTFVPGSQQPPFLIDPRPPRINLNRHCYKFVQGRCNHLLPISLGRLAR